MVEEREWRGTPEPDLGEKVRRFPGLVFYSLIRGQNGMCREWPQGLDGPSDHGKATPGSRITLALCLIRGHDINLPTIYKIYSFIYLLLPIQNHALRGEELKGGTGQIGYRKKTRKRKKKRRKKSEVEDGRFLNNWGTCEKM